MTSRVRTFGLVATLALASMLAGALAWATVAESQPAPQNKLADIQLLGVNDFHGNLESPRALPRDGSPSPVPVGGAA